MRPTTPRSFFLNGLFPQQQDAIGSFQQVRMTSLAFAIDVLPLVTSAGAEMRHPLRLTVFSGMMGVTGFGLLLTPVFYVVIRGLATRRAAAALAAPATSTEQPAPVP